MKKHTELNRYRKTRNSLTKEFLWNEQQRQQKTQSYKTVEYISNHISLWVNERMHND